MSAEQLPGEALLTRVAELMGWTKDEELDFPWQWIDPKGEGIYKSRELPDYVHDLDAIAAAERTLSDEEHTEFRKHLREIVQSEAGVSPMSDAARRAYISASAEQRARAFVMTMEGRGL